MQPIDVSARDDIDRCFIKTNHALQGSDGGAVTSYRNPASAVQRPVVIEASSFEWKNGGLAECAAVAADGGDLAVTDTTFWGVGRDRAAVSFTPSGFRDDANRLEVRGATQPTTSRATVRVLRRCTLNIRGYQ